MPRHVGTRGFCAQVPWCRNQSICARYCFVTLCRHVFCNFVTSSSFARAELETCILVGCFPLAIVLSMVCYMSFLMDTKARGHEVLVPRCLGAEVKVNVHEILFCYIFGDIPCCRLLVVSAQNSIVACYTCQSYFRHISHTWDRGSPKSTGAEIKRHVQATTSDVRHVFCLWSELVAFFLEVSVAAFFPF
jgi:hypothetical protein